MNDLILKYTLGYTFFNYQHSGIYCSSCIPDDNIIYRKIMHNKIILKPKPDNTVTPDYNDTL